MKPIHIKGWSRDRLARLQAPRRAKTTWENKLFPTLSPPTPLPCSSSHHKRYQVWEDRHVLLIMRILNKYCNGHLICCGVLSVLNCPRRRRKCGSPDMVLKCIPRGLEVFGFVRMELVVEVETLNTGCGVSGIRWTRLNRHVALGDEIRCSHRVHSHKAVPTLSNVLKLVLLSLCCTFCQEDPHNERNRGERQFISFCFTWALTVLSCPVSLLCSFYVGFYFRNVKNMFFPHTLHSRV